MIETSNGDTTNLHYSLPNEEQSQIVIRSISIFPHYAREGKLACCKVAPQRANRRPSLIKLS